jgi:vesicle-associated membrane protein 7
MFHVVVADGITFLIMAEESFGRRIPFAFLEDVRARFTSSYGNAQGVSKDDVIHFLCL